MKINAEESFTSILAVTPLYDRNTELFKIWRKFDAGCAFFSTLALISATYDYEVNYSNARTYSNCHEKNLHSEGFRFTTLLLSLIGIVFTMIRFYYKSLWLETMSKLNTITHPLHYFARKKYVQKRNLAIEILLLLIIPYPYMTSYVYIPIRIEKETRITCYTLAELCYCFMFFRCFFIIRSISNFSSFQNEWARMSCEKYSTKPGFSFAFKSLVKTSPTFMITLLFMILLIFSSLVYRVLERPLDEFSREYNSDPFTPLWVIFETISTTGYGDLYPVTYFGRTVSVLAYLLGAIIFSLLILKLQDVTDLNSNQKQVFEHVSLSKSAAAFIKAAIKFFIAKRRYRPGHPMIFSTFFEMKRWKKKFTSAKAKNQVVDFSMTESILMIKNEVALAKLQLQHCNNELNRCIDLFKSI